MFRSFYKRILLLIVGLVVVAQLTTFLALLNTLDKGVGDSCGNTCYR